MGFDFIQSHDAAPPDVPPPFTSGSFGRQTEPQLHIAAAPQVFPSLPHLASPWPPCPLTLLPATPPWRPCFPPPGKLSPELPTWLTPFVLHSQLRWHLLRGASPAPREAGPCASPWCCPLPGPYHSPRLRPFPAFPRASSITRPRAWPYSLFSGTVQRAGGGGGTLTFLVSEIHHALAQVKGNWLAYMG